MFDESLLLPKNSLSILLSYWNTKSTHNLHSVKIHRSIHQIMVYFRCFAESISNFFHHSHLLFWHQRLTRINSQEKHKKHFFVGTFSLSLSEKFLVRFDPNNNRTNDIASFIRTKIVRNIFFRIDLT